MNHQNHLLTLIFLFACLCGTIFTQTFQYSRGWTNGKKRSSIESFIIQEGSEGPEVYGICQMQRLKEIWANRNLDDVSPLALNVISVLSFK